MRSRAKNLGLSDEFFSKSDIHLHIPAGAQPKDGPSAGVAMATALVSLISGRKLKPRAGMTGEITLRGQVHRNGLRTVILPKRNEHDLDDVPDEIKQSMKFVFVETVDDVLDSALEAKRKSPILKTTKKSTAARKAKANGKNTSRRG